MKANKTYCKITTDETLRETVSHDSEEYPFCYYLEDDRYMVTRCPCTCPYIKSFVRSYNSRYTPNLSS